MRFSSFNEIITIGEFGEIVPEKPCLTNYFIELLGNEAL